MARRFVLGLLAVAVLTAATGCAGFLTRATPTSKPGKPVPTTMLEARDAALTFLRGRYPASAPAADARWVGLDTTPPDFPATTSAAFSSSSWVMNVWSPLVSTGTLFEIDLGNHESGLHWAGKLDQGHMIMESNWNIPVDALVVRDSVLDYYRQAYPEMGLPVDLLWIGERTTPEGSTGYERCRFVAAGWQLDIAYEVARPDQVLYQVQLANPAASLDWQCQVDAQGQILEIRPPSSS